MDNKTIQPMDLLIRDEARDLERIRESLDSFVDREPLSLRPEYNLECNPEINVDIDTEGIESELASMGSELAELTYLQREAIETARKGFNGITGALQGIQKVGVFWQLDKSLLNPDLYRAKYLELMLNNIIPSSQDLSEMLFRGHAYMKLYALAEMAEQRVYSPEVFTSLVDGNAIIAGYAAYALPRINPPLTWKGQALPTIDGRSLCVAPANSPAFDGFSVALKKNKATTRSRTIKVLGVLTDGWVFWKQLLEMAGNDQSEKVRRSAEWSLMQFGRKILPDLEKMLKSLNQNDLQFKRGKSVRDNILQQYTLPPLTYLKVYRNDILENIIPTFNRLVELVQKGDYYEKLYAMAELGAQKRYDNSLVAAISSKNKIVAGYAWYALSEIQPLVFKKGTTVTLSPQNYQNLQQYLSSPNYAPPSSDSRYYQYTSIALTNAPVFDTLMVLLQNKDARVRGRAAWALGRLPGGYAAYWELLVVSCYDINKSTRDAATRSLRRFGTKIIEQLDHIIKVGGVDPKLYHKIKRLRARI